MSIAAVPNSRETYLGHVRHGMIVPDAPIPLAEGTPVRFEMLADTQPEPSLAEKLKAFDELVKKWDEEDALLTEEQQDALRKALEENRGLRFRDNELNDLLK